jgi:CheY-like chemotaxis protein
MTQPSRKTQARPPRRVLVVEDHETTREVIAVALREEGCEVRAAATGAAGLDLLEGNTVDLILLDVRMPGMDGRAFVERYRASSGPYAPILLMTAVAYADDLVNELHVEGRIKKPFDLDLLLETVNRFCPRVEPPDVT